MGPKITEGYLDVSVPGADKPCQTWYRISGDLTSSHTPVVALHGGPGFTSEYLRPLEELTTQYGIPVITYDQVGCGHSTRLPEKKGDESFWTVGLFLGELNHVLESLGVADKYVLYGHSWGGMLASEHAVLQPSGMRKLILSNTPSSIPLWGAVAQKYLRAFPQDMQDKIAKHEAEGTVSSEEYETEITKYTVVHTMNVQPFPEHFVNSFTNMMKDPTVYHTMQGPSEFTITGSLKEWSMEDRAKDINVPTLLINGKDDIADETVLAPFVKNIPDNKMITFEKSSHMPQYEEPEAYLKALAQFLEA